MAENLFWGWGWLEIIHITKLCEMDSKENYTKSFSVMLGELVCLCIFMMQPGRISM
jgi:hypothetical protein